MGMWTRVVEKMAYGVWIDGVVAEGRRDRVLMDGVH